LRIRVDRHRFPVPRKNLPSGPHCC
jgi:hypothetical protein